MYVQYGKYSKSSGWARGVWAYGMSVPPDFKKGGFQVHVEGK